MLKTLDRPSALQDICTRISTPALHDQVENRCD